MIQFYSSVGSVLMAYTGGFPIMFAMVCFWAALSGLLIFPFLGAALAFRKLRGANVGKPLSRVAIGFVLCVVYFYTLQYFELAPTEGHDRRLSAFTESEGIKRGLLFWFGLFELNLLFAAIFLPERIFCAAKFYFWDAMKPVNNC